ncbi:Trp biosynthesis-associated membrane protein [Nonomuraea muscovyensis]|uniref:Putative membrane protein (TIGR02234 family) n=1 Tax=Nonomuraea muscovyensis TaxID=1124761 RepID=A0A7X0BW64_9ACTN|nr:Trp biosynthesis-associated membrane protein [Nonomuraea muscovyensis]MBB6343930.1 putative membrane protein (TIGR02234 family) [Nonomuraea muscovyensis]
MTPPDRPTAPPAGVPAPGAAGPGGGAAERAGQRRRSGSGRELGAWVLVTALGCVLVLFATTRPWVSGVRGAGAHGGAPATPTGGDLGPALVPVALAGLAGVVAALAAKGVARRVIGALVALCGFVAGFATWLAAGGQTVLGWLREHNVLQAADALQWDTVALWPALSGLGAALTAAGGVVAVVRGGRWAGMSDRYERDPARRPSPDAGDRALWDALDRGDDPTS